MPMTPPKIYRQVAVDAPPDKTGTYLTNIGEVEWINDDRSFLGFWKGKPNIKYWLEEVELPTEEFIDHSFPNRDHWDKPMEVNILRNQGAKWVIDYINGKK